MELDERIKNIRETHIPRTAELDQGPDDVCAAHTMGYPPKWPCILRQLADKVVELEEQIDTYELLLFTS